jgi:hypothetical protein
MPRARTSSHSWSTDTDVTRHQFHPHVPVLN